MVFNLKDAKIIANHYQHLVGEVMEESTGIKIRAVLVAPALSSDNNHRKIFLEHYIQHANNEAALSFSGFNPEEMEIMLLGTTNRHVLYPTKDFNKFLTDNGIEKIYPIQ